MERLIIFFLLLLSLPGIGQNLNQVRPDTAAGSVPMTMAPTFRMQYVRPQTLADTLAPYLPSGHSPVTLSGAPDYITLSGQDIIRGQIDLTTDVSGLLPGTNINSITESQISDLDHFTGADITGSETAFNGWDKDASNDVTELSDLTDVNTSTPTNRNVLIADGVDWESRALTEADISDFGTYLTAEVDGSITNEGSLTVGAGTSTTSLISSNTSGSTDVTIEVGSGLSIAEASNTITLANTGVLSTAGDWTGTLDGFEGSVLNQNFANTNLSTLNSRSHNWNSQDLTIFGLNQLSLLTSTSLQWIVLNTTGVDLQGTTHNFGATTSIVLDAPDIILEDALTLSTWDTILTRHPTTGEIQGLLVSALTITESQISDLQAYLTAEVNDLSAAVTWANVPDANITESSVTQHEAALTITESQISDLSHTGPAGSTTQIQFNKAGVFGTEPEFTVTGSGTGLRVGIGIAVPAGKLHIHTATAGGAANVQYTNSTTGSTIMDGFYTGYGSEAYFVNYENTPILFYTNGTERLDIGASGQLQIPAYDAGAFDATPVKYLGLDASENIITFDTPAPVLDSLGRNGTAGQIVFETATKAGNSDAGLFWDNTSKTLIVDGTSGTSSIQMQNAEYLGAKDASGTAKRVFGISVANHVYLGAIDDVGGDVRFREDGADVMGFSGARVGIGTVAPAASAKLEISSTTGAFLPPRMNSTQRDALTAVDGMILYNSTTSKLQVRAGGAWVDLH